jgi:integrase
MLRGVLAGVDPRSGFTSKDVTMEELWQVTRQDVYNNGKKWDKEAARLWRVYLAPKLASYKVKAVTPPILDQVASSMRRTPTQANRAMAVVSKMFKVAIRKGVIEPRDNPTGYIPRYKEESRDRYATPDELSALAAEIRKLPLRNYRARAFFWLLLYSGARPSEIERATWGQLYDQPNGSGVLVIKEGKRGRRRVILPPQAMAEIARLPEGGKHDLLVGIKFPQRIWNRMHEAAGCPDLWDRDLRRTFATVGLNDAKAPLSIIGDVLGHRSVQTTKIYAKLRNDTAREAVEDIADEIDEIISRDGAASPSSAEPVLPVVSGVS